MVVGCNLRSMALRAVQQKKGACDRGKIRKTNPDTRHPRAPCWGRERSPGKPWAQTGLRRLLGVKTQSQKSTWSSRGPAPGPRFTQNLSLNR